MSRLPDVGVFPPYPIRTRRIRPSALRTLRMGADTRRIRPSRGGYKEVNYCGINKVYISRYGHAYVQTMYTLMQIRNSDSELIIVKLIGN